MKLNSYLLNTFDIITKCIPNSSIYIHKSEDFIDIKLTKNDFIQINKGGISLNGINLEPKILTSKINKHTIKLKVLKLFIEKIRDDIKRINHIGISYTCNNFETEMSFYKEICNNGLLKMYEEKSGNDNSRWFFLGDKNENYPLFEIVLTKSKSLTINDWVPHFQIDIDTTLSYEQILTITNEIIIKDFVKWHLHFPNYGTVLAMGFLGTINGTKISLGLGTSLRGKQILVEV